MARVVIFTGAGISAPSGIRTFRDGGGLWEEYRIDEVCSVGCLEHNYDTTIDFYDARRQDLANKQPNKAHIQIAKLAQKYPQDIRVITQNVDDLFEKSNCPNVLHLHGFLPHVRCMNDNCDYRIDIGYNKLDKNARCPQCNSGLRPDVVFFGEAAPMYAALYQEVERCEFFVVIGTSGEVINTDILLMGSMRHTILNNLEPSRVIDETRYEKVLYQSATQAIDTIIADITAYLEA